MSPKKNKQNMSSQKKDPSPAKPSRFFKRFGLTVFWGAVLAIGLWALMDLSTPENNLVPYKQVKQTLDEADKERDEKPDENSSLDFETASNDLDLDSKDLIKKASTDSEPKSELPRKTLEHISKGMELTEQGKHNQANMEFEKAAIISPDSNIVFSIWGAALKMQKKYKGANKKFARAHELAPEDKEIVFNWALSTLEERNSDEAIRLFELAVKMEPANYLAYNFLGKAYGQKKFYDKEMASYRKAIELKPDFGAAHFNLGIILGIKKKFEEAAPHFEKAIAIDKSFEKPFVVQMLTAMGLREAKNDGDKSSENATNPEPVKDTQPDITAELKKSLGEKSSGQKSEGSGSDHKMEEGSKNVKDTTNVKGKILVNGKALPTNAVVFLETQNKLRVPGQKTVDMTIKQANLSFFPKHTMIPVGSIVTFANQDKEVHNIFSKSQNNQFNLGAMAAGSSRSLTFDQAGPVVLRCNLHKDMLGTIFVVPNGYSTHPDAKGEFTFDKVKSQGYLLQVWHPSLLPEEVAANLKPVDLKGVDKTFDMDIKSASRPGEIHDLVDPTDYNAIVDSIEKEMSLAIADWKKGKKFIPRKRMLMVITKHFDGEGLKGAIAKSFSQKRSIQLEKKLDEIRKLISGIGVKKADVTEELLTSRAKFAVSQLRNNVRELEARLNPDSNKK
jgi:tetratricopeptide (TPR) repeat protein